MTVYHKQNEVALRTACDQAYEKVIALYTLAYYEDRPGRIHVDKADDAYHYMSPEELEGYIEPYEKRIRELNFLSTTNWLQALKQIREEQLTKFRKSLKLPELRKKSWFQSKKQPKEI